MYSLPDRRAWSPLQSSLGPRIAKSTPALEQLGQRATRLLVAVVEAARATDEVEVLVLERRARLDDLDALERRGPIAAVALVEAVRVAGVLHRAEGVAELGGEVALHEREVAAHVEDLVEDLDVHRADLVARLAARAGPQLLRRDALEHAVGADRDAAVDTDGRRDDRVTVAAITSPTFNTISRGSSGFPVACAGHTDATPADRARVGVEQLLPGEVLDLHRTEASRGRSP